MADESLLKEVESELKIDDDNNPGPWFFINNLIIITLSCLFLIAGLKINGVAFSPLFGISAFFGLVYLGRDKT